MRNVSIIILIAVVVAACGGRSATKQSTAAREEVQASHRLEVPQPPALLTDNGARLEYVAQHFWDNFDFGGHLRTGRDCWKPCRKARRHNSPASGYGRRKDAPNCNCGWQTSPSFISTIPIPLSATRIGISPCWRGCSIRGSWARSTRCAPPTSWRWHGRTARA